MLSLSDIERAPERIRELTPGEAHQILSRVASLIPSLNAQVLGAFRDYNGSADRLVSVKEAAGMLGHSRIWIYENKDRLPFVVQDGRSIRCSFQGVQQYIKRKGEE
jgi:hypothetical protein